jgi:short-subunit dehydrogenase
MNENKKYKPVVVVGATGGIGSAIAEVLVEWGYDVILVGRNSEKLLKLKAKLGPHTAFWQVDFTNKKSVEELFPSIHNHTGTLQGLILAAGDSIPDDSKDENGQPLFESVEESIQANIIANVDTKIPLFESFHKTFKDTETETIVGFVSSHVNDILTPDVIQEQGQIGYATASGMISSYAEKLKEDSDVHCHIYLSKAGPIDTPLLRKRYTFIPEDKRTTPKEYANKFLTEAGFTKN